MVDRVYKSGIPEKRRALEELKAEFSELPSRTDWVALRIEPLLQHVKRLEVQLKSEKSKRLSKGVRLFHSDLVYLRENVNGLREILRSEKESPKKRAKTPGNRTS
jgi:hypothetical protein